VESENWELRRTFEPGMDEIGGSRRKSQNEFHNFYTSPNMFRMIMSRGIT
jgi:hypothetical protein